MDKMAFRQHKCKPTQTSTEVQLDFHIVCPASAYVAKQLTLLFSRRFRNAELFPGRRSQLAGRNIGRFCVMTDAHNTDQRSFGE